MVNTKANSRLFDRDKSVILRHIKNIFVEKEGKRQIKREIDYYNLDMIISVGYRVKSKNDILD